ncbi:probable calcium-binding protein CML35 [Olea europaea var. sylvestris]|uniref:Probable calcium-binding CML36 n=1 Tax=Olea europaea subsp. europaea TaxID=158383 RepID=A0A8S0QH10_OLEEU|nr:probable calcium-binding protein CML35 [Olea europaea var. sylvestris]CAA2966591.1 probable calcium-binding CML36 [Olea europaea subsp. europaea]
MSTMKFIKIVPKKLFKSRKSQSVSRSENDPSSFSSQATSSSADDSHSGLKKPLDGLDTPTSVLPSLSSGEWSEFSADVYFELKQAFEMIDREGTGKVKKEELKALLSSIGAEPPSQEELTMMLNEVDRDGDGCISLEEFYTIGSAFGTKALEADLRETFDFFDSDRDGKIAAEELLNVFKTIGDSRCTLEDCRRMIGGADRNGDGFVCFEDFRRLMGLQR